MQIRKMIVNNVILGVLFPAHSNFVRLREVFFEWKMKNLWVSFLINIAISTSGQQHKKY